MPAARAFAMRPAGALRLPRQCRLPSLTEPPLVLRLNSNRRRQPSGLALVIVPFSHQCRSKSTSSHTPGAGGLKSAAPKPTLRGMLWRAIVNDAKRAWHNIRNSSFKDVMRNNPGEAFGAIVAMIGTVAVLGYCVYVYFTYFNSPQFTRFPEPIAQALRKALYFSNHEPDPQRALKYYKQALELCDEHGLDHFSDDVMGIKIQVAAWLEKIQSFQNAIDVLENLLQDCKRWVAAMEKSAEEGTLPKHVPVRPPKEGEEAPEVPEQPRETFWGKRTRILAKAIGISVKLAGLYSDEHVLERELAHERLVWAVETTLRELQRRSREGLKEGEGPWMNPEEVGGSMESLAQSYMEKSQHHLAIPLLFQALRLCQDPCHIALLMNNIATSFAEHPLIKPGEAPVHAMMEESKSWVTPAEQRAAYLEAAERWARNAIGHASEPRGDKRTPECDQACAAALSNLGSVLVMLGKTAEAREKFTQAVEMSKKIGLDEYAAQAEAGLQGLAAKA
ncbi:hypothetical protein VTK26DRAFT_6038 [Humicola hyalothermophila]